MKINHLKYHYILHLMIVGVILTINLCSCVTGIKNMAIQTKNESVHLALILHTTKSEDTTFFSKERQEWLKFACKKNNIEEAFEIEGDSLIYIDIQAPTFASFNNLMNSFSNAIMGTPKLKNTFMISLKKSDSLCEIEIKFREFAFVNNSMLSVSCPNQIISPNPNVNTNFANIILTSTEQVSYTFPSINQMSDSDRIIRVTYPISNSKSNWYKSITGWFLDTFEEKLWMRLAAVLGAMASVIGIITFFRRKSK